MKIKIEIDDGLMEEEVIIRCRELNDDMVLIQKKITDAINSKMQLQVMKSDKEYFLTVDEILFLEATGSAIAVHTREQIFETKQKLYELEELLPGSFMRVSKSTIINTGKIRAIHKNITGASEVEFAGTPKLAYVSRSYIKALFEKMQEKRLGR